MSTTMTGTDFIAPIRAELDDFEQRLHATVRADLGPVAEAMEQILDAGGKRLRPALVFLAAGFGRGSRPDDVQRAAMAIEFIHNATLIHDDLIDGAPTRRGLRTINESLGANPAIIIDGGTGVFASINAPQANLKFTGGGNFYGAAIAQTIDDQGGTNFFWDTSQCKPQNATFGCKQRIQSAVNDPNRHRAPALSWGFESRKGCRQSTK